ncbi:DUF4351 domain-containing protein [Crocosphaera watsonii]|uniref:DUF4351 domain-containing protein n=3 Tax=Aphanothecaceae TaxID=1890450 RepID=G5IZ85_CROWT|nr:DUF4351 domain-containing protein [Crocosphaera watsonii]EHJ14748.1 hypothetical protein CWATWH0003_0580 [Crocosphaera watsonii WH 0003]CCQ56993.1 hypothetical protein CWATWH0005_480 [Crocosphaera watsonii WH 0005]
MYKFDKLSQTEVEEMLGITLKETQVYREIKQEGREEGREEGQKSLLLRLLTRKVGELSSEVRQNIDNLSIEQLENLGEALLDFSSMVDLENWLKTHQ